MASDEAKYVRLSDEQLTDAVAVPNDVPNRSPTDQESSRSDEQRRIGLELHDATSRLLVVLELRLAAMRRIDPRAESLVTGCEQAIAEIREQIVGMFRSDRTSY